MKNKINNETKAEYNAKNNDSETAIIKQAIAILDGRIKRGDALTSPQNTRDFLRLKLSSLEHEIFACLFLDNRNRVIEFVEMFRGTIDGASVYPREVIKEALKHNASAVIFTHNHPSGVAEPSHADEQITVRLKDALNMIDIRVLDHMIIGDDIVSFAERGLL